VYLTGHFIDVMDVDATHYAALSVEMMHSDNWLEVYMRGGDYLDKPPLLFWISALSFKLFGVGNFTYRLFPVLLSFLGIFSTYKLSRLFYTATVSYYAAILFATSQAVFLMNHDVRTDNILTTCITLAIWQLMAFVQNGKSRHALLGCVAIGLAMLAKGPIGLIAPAIVVGIHLLLTRQLAICFKWQWLVGIGLIALLLLPMCIGLYQQFDAQPEKIVHGETNVSGLKFFFWTQSFGRITGESIWDNNPGPFFQVSSFLWSFLPWTIFALMAYLSGVRELIRSKFTLKKEMDGFSIGGVTLIFIMMSLSAYQLPHYTYPAYPLVAIFTGRWLHGLIQKISEKRNRFIIRFHISSIIVMGLLCLVSIGMLVSTTASINVVFLAVLLALLGWYLWKWFPFHWLVKSTVGVILSVNLMLNLQFYPFITTYQSGSQAGKYVANLSPPPAQLYAFLTAPMSLDFYSGHITKGVLAATDLFTFEEGEYILFTSHSGLVELKQLGLHVKVLQAFDDYPITTLSPDFLFNQEIRKTLPKNYVVKLVIEKSAL
jgi:4-amino-4-deoxy-L-arabinose transferase-like glycosyltransferase